MDVMKKSDYKVGDELLIKHPFHGNIVTGKVYQVNIPSGTLWNYYILLPDGMTCGVDDKYIIRKATKLDKALT